MRKTVEILDSTLRDGAQGEGISFSVEDKLAVTRLLDGLGVSYIEAGNPGSNPKDLEFFRRAGELKLRHSRLVAFGSTRRKNRPAAELVHRSLGSGEFMVIAISSTPFFCAEAARQ